MYTFTDLPSDICELIYKYKHKLELKDVLTVMKRRKRKYEKYMITMRDVIIKYQNREITGECCHEVCQKYKTFLNSVKFMPFTQIGNSYAESSIETQTYNNVSKHVKYFSRQPMFLIFVKKHHLQELCAENLILYTKKETKKELINKLLTI